MPLIFGKVYSEQLNIANTKDGRFILYDINKISEIGINSVLADENAVQADSPAASQNPNSAKGGLTQTGSVVKTKSAQNNKKEFVQEFDDNLPKPTPEANLESNSNI